MNNQEYDYEDYAIRYDVKQPDGRIVLKDAFKNCDGQSVPLVYNFYQSGGSHIPDTSFENILGTAYLENRYDGVYARCVFHEWFKELGMEKYIKALSVFARINATNEQGISNGKIMAIKVMSR